MASMTPTISLAPDGSQLLIVDEGEASSYSIDSGEITPIDVAPLGGQLALDAFFTPDGSQFVVPTDGGRLHLFDAASLAPVDVDLPDSPVGLAAFAPDGTLAIGGEMSVTFWDVATNTALNTVDFELAVDMQPSTFVFSADMRWLAGAERQGRIVVWDLADGRLVGDPSTRPQVTRPIAFDPVEPSILAIGSADGGITMHDVESGQQVGEPLRGQPGGARALAFSGDGRLFATTNDDGTIGLWVDSGGPSLLSTPLDGQLRLFDASTDGNVVVVGDRSTAEVRRLDAPDAAPIVLSPPADPNVQVWWDLSADGSRVLGGAVVEPESGGRIVPHAHPRHRDRRGRVVDRVTRPELHPRTQRRRLLPRRTHRWVRAGGRDRRRVGHADRRLRHQRRIPRRKPVHLGHTTVIGDGERYAVAGFIGVATFDLDGTSEFVAVDPQAGLQGPIVVLDDGAIFAVGFRGGIWRAEVPGGEARGERSLESSSLIGRRGERRWLGRRSLARVRVVDRAVRRIDPGADRRTDRRRRRR